MRTLIRLAPAPRLLALAMPAMLLAGCNAAFLGNLVVMGLTVCIFVATLSLGRSADASRADASTATQSRTASPS